MRKRPPEGVTVPGLAKGKLQAVHTHGAADSSAN